MKDKGLQLKITNEKNKNNKQITAIVWNLRRIKIKTTLLHLIIENMYKIKIKENNLLKNVTELD